MAVVKLAGVLGILGVVVFSAGLAFVNPLVQRQEGVDPIGYVSDNKARVRGSAALTVVGLLLASIAFPVWWSSLPSRPRPELNMAGSALLAFGVVFWAIYAFLRSERPKEYPFFAFTWQGFLSALGTILGLGAYGVLFVLAPTASWLGYFFVVFSVGLLIGLVLKVLPPIAYFLPILIAAVVFLLS